MLKLLGLSRAAADDPAAAASGAARRAVRKNVRGEQDYDLGVVLRRSIVGRYDVTEDFSNSYYRY